MKEEHREREREWEEIGWQSRGPQQRYTRDPDIRAVLNGLSCLVGHNEDNW